MGMLIVRHKVKDYSKWRLVFDQHARAQETGPLRSPAAIDGERRGGIVPAESDVRNTAIPRSSSTVAKRLFGCWAKSTSPIT